MEKHGEADGMLKQAIAIIEPIKAQAPYLYEACLLGLGRNNTHRLEVEESLDFWEVVQRKTLKAIIIKLQDY